MHLNNINDGIFDRIYLNYNNTIQNISDKDLDICQSCKKGGIKKLISSSGFRLKGSGWYETDFKGKKVKEDKSAPNSNTTDKP
jgi:predicted nucleic acid-binding Zn ribbon protein